MTARPWPSCCDSRPSRVKCRGVAAHIAGAGPGLRAGGSPYVSALLAPVLVRTARATPQLDPRPVGGPLAVGVQTEPRLRCCDRAVGVDVPLLVWLSAAVPDGRRGAVARALADAQALVAVDNQLLSGRVGPPLVRAAVAVPQLCLRAVGRGRVVDVEAAPRLLAHDLLVAGRRWRRLVRAELGEELPHRRRRPGAPAVT